MIIFTLKIHIITDNKNNDKQPTFSLEIIDDINGEMWLSVVLYLKDDGKTSPLEVRSDDVYALELKKCIYDEK